MTTDTTMVGSHRTYTYNVITNSLQNTNNKLED